jgi:membrane dipeptidase
MLSLLFSLLLLSFPMLPWFDAHLDLACLAENGRDMTRAPQDSGGPWQPASATFPSLRDGLVRAFLGTIFTEADGDDAVAYPARDAEAAHHAGLRQLRRYQQWHKDGYIDLGDPILSSPLVLSPRPPTCLILMECADPIRTPEEVRWWAAQGVIAIGMVWARGSRYAAGNSEPSCSSPHGLTDLGRALVREMDALGIVHDASHLSDRALHELFELTTRPIVATHSNARALLSLPAKPGSQRHLTDETIREITRRGGVIGLNLCANFIRPGLNRGDRPTIDEAIAHVEHICDIAGHRRAVGLGSDLDGGFSALHLPQGIDLPRDFQKLADALAQRNWNDDDIHRFAWSNWADFWSHRRAG